MSSAETGARAALAELLEQAHELYRDTTFASVRRWKERTGGLAIGFLPIYVPRELLHAQGVLPVGIMGGGDDLEIIRGDAYYQSYICHLPRSTLELGLDGSLDCLDGMLFPAICDVIRNLSGVWKLCFPSKLARYLDLPQNFDADTGGAFLRRELEDLARELAERGALPLEPARLAASIRTYDANRRVVAKLQEARSREPWRVPTSELYLLLRAGLVIPVEEHTAMLERYLELAAADDSRQPLDQARVLMTGCFCEQPPLGLIKTLERAGCSIVDDDLVQVHRWIQREIGSDGLADPLGALVGAFLRDSIAGPTRYVGEDEKGRDLIERVARCRAEGVLFSAPSFCDPALLDQPMTAGAVERAGIPWTAFKYAENNSQFQVIREQAGTFADSIKLWSGA